MEKVKLFKYDTESDSEATPIEAFDEVLSADSLKELDSIKIGESCGLEHCKLIRVA